MSGDFELCPKCKQGHLYPEGRAGVDLEAKGDFRETASMRDLICDHCGRRQKNAELKEYGGPATEIVSGVVTKADPEDKEENKFSILFTIKSEKHLSLPKSKAQIESYRVARYFKLM